MRIILGLAALVLAACAVPGGAPDCDASKGKALSRVDGAWRCDDLVASDGPVAISRLTHEGCASGQVLRFESGAWACGADEKGAGGTGDVSTSGSYADPAWLTSIAGSKVTGEVASAEAFTGQLGGDVSGTQAATKVERLQGRPVTTAEPAVGDVLKWTGSAWAPAPDVVGTGDVVTTGHYEDPAWIKTLAGSKIAGEVALATEFGGSLAGDVNGHQYELKVNALQGRPLATKAPASGDVLRWNGAAWEPAPDLTVGLTGSGSASTAARSDHAHTGVYLSQADLDEAARCPRLALADGTVRTYAREPAFTTTLVCRAGADVMVKAGDFWIDRWEASLVDAPKWNGGTCSGTSGKAYASAGGATPTDDYPVAFPDSGQYTLPVYACSIPATVPSRMVTWFQAAQACALAGKHLCRNDEWQLAAAGTPDPGASDGADGRCLTNGTQPRATGAVSLGVNPALECRSKYGAEDLIGNLAEWTADWWQAGRTWQTVDGQISGTPWPSGYGDGADRTWALNGTAAEGSNWTLGAPAALARGGAWLDGENAGVFATNASYAPSARGAHLGARCCAGGR